MKTMTALLSATAVGLLLTTVAAYAAGGNQTYLTQTGNSQSAMITQSGGSNNRVGSSVTPFLQQNGAGAGSNKLVINQNSGVGSELANIGSFVSAGSGNVATGSQTGTSNGAEIDQEGNDSTVHLQQSGKGNGPAAGGWFNNTYGNLILQDSTADASSISLIQTNDVNATNGNVFSIGQGGYDNEITATQTGYNKLWIRQGTTAPDLWSWTYGNLFSPVYTANSLGTLSGSSITINQTVGGTNPAQRNYAALGQGNGAGNVITVTQNGGSNNVDANQVGSGNVFNSSQSSTDGNTNWNFVGGEAGWPDSSINPLTGLAADFQPIAQIGNNNEYYATQSGTDQWALGSQLGDGNFLSSVQSGSVNKLFSTQDGNDNEIYSSQTGSLNTTTVSQTLNGNYSNSSQNGNGNTATITQ